MPEKRLTRTQGNFIQRLVDNTRRTIRETIGELHKVSWPTRQEALNLTRIVLIVIFMMGAYLGLLDFVFARAVKVILG